MTRNGGKTERMALIGNENTWTEHSRSKTAHASLLKIRPGQDSGIKIMEFVG